jgi:hypothetical protein
VIRQEREERAGEVALNRKKTNELQSRIGELETRVQAAQQTAEKKQSDGESIATVKLRLSVAEKESARLRGELNTAIDNSREQARLAAESLNALETKRFELERDLADVNEERDSLDERLEAALKAAKAANGTGAGGGGGGGGPCEQCAENIERLEEEQDRLERTQQAAAKALEAARRAATSLSELEQAKAQSDAELATTKFELEKATLTGEGLRIKLADLTKKIGAPPPDVAVLQTRIDELEARLSARPEVGFVDADSAMHSPTLTPKLSRRGRVAVLAEKDSGYDSAEEGHEKSPADSVSPSSSLAKAATSSAALNESGAASKNGDADESGGELRAKLTEAEAERTRLLDANKKLRDERDALQEQLREAKEAAAGGDAPITGGPPPPPMMGGAAAAAGGGPPPPPPPMPAFKKTPNKLVIKKSGQSAALEKSSDSPKAGGAGQTTAAIVDAIKSGVKLRKTERPPRNQPAAESKNAGLVDLSNLGSLASTIARERRQRAAVSSQRMQRATAEQDAISAASEPAAAPFPKLRPVGLPKGESRASPQVSPSLSRLHPLRPAAERPGANRPGANRPGGDGEGIRAGMRRAATMTPEMRKAVTASMDSVPQHTSSTSAVAAAARPERPTGAGRPLAATNAGTPNTASRASYATSRPTTARDGEPARSPVDTSSRASYAGVQRGRVRGNTAAGLQPSVRPTGQSVDVAKAANVAAPAIVSPSRLAQASAVDMDDDDESTEEIPTTPLPIAPTPTAAAAAPELPAALPTPGGATAAAGDDDEPPPLPSTPAPSAGKSSEAKPAELATSGSKIKKKKKKSSHKTAPDAPPALPDDNDDDDDRPRGIARNNSSYRNHSGLDEMIAGLDSDK